MNYSKQTAFALSLALILGACGGGSENNDQNTNVGGNDTGNNDQNTDLGGNDTPDVGGNDTSDLVGSGSLSECFNPVLFQDGTFYRYSVTLPVGDSVRITNQTISITTNIDWNGTLYTREVGERSQPNSNAIASRDSSYLSVDFDNQIVDQAGRVEVFFDDETGDVVGTITEIYTPPIRTRFDLNPGETFTQTFQINRTSDFGSINEINNEVEEATKTDRFLGIESISRANGNLDTCRAKSDIVMAPGTPNEEILESLTIWLGKDNGLFVQYEPLFDGEPVGLFQIESAEINDASVF